MRTWRAALFCLGLACFPLSGQGQPPTAEPAQPVGFLDQGWSAETRALFYYSPQGSELIPLDVFMALERPDGQGLFSDSAYLAQFGFIAGDGPHPLNPANLPIGFAVEPASAPGGAPMLGLTCAACHTAQVTVQGRTLRIDGAPAHLDFDRFLAALDAAVTRSFFDAAAFRGFAARMGGQPTPSAIGQLRARLANVQSHVAGEAALRRPALPSGPGRVDALTQIVNALAVVSQNEPRNLRPPAAPTSYPQLWLAPQLEYVQWNPIAANVLGRNAGQVLGVFGRSNLIAGSPALYSSSIRLRELAAIESWVETLQPPRWDETLLGPIDRARASQGEALFREHCGACHNVAPYRRTDPAANAFGRTFIAVCLVEYLSLGTDPNYVESLLARLVRVDPATRLDQSGRSIMPGAQFFTDAVGQIVGRAIRDAGLSADEVVAMSGFRLRPSPLPGGDLLPYVPRAYTEIKAPTLAGVWATGPYLHNGSVATVYEVLSPPAERRPVFWTGGRELDRERLGYVSDEGPGRFRFDTSQPGNRNSGHLYPREGLSPEQRRAVIEYLKTL